MVKKEKKAHIISIPLYVLKLILKKVLKREVTPYKVVSFSQFRDKILKFDYGIPFLVKSFKPLNQHDLTTKQNNLFQIIDSIYRSRTRVLKLDNVVLFGLEGVVASPKGELLIDHYYGDSFKDNIVRKTGYISRKYHIQYMVNEVFIPSKSLVIEEAVIVTTQWSENYYHWFNYVIPKIKSVEALNINTKNIVINKMKHEFQRSSLNLLFPEFNFVETKSKQKIIIKTAFLPETTSENPQKVFYLRDKIQIQNQESNIRLYISRQKSRNRKLINSKEVKKILDDFRFVEVFLEELSFKEQINIINRSQIIVSPHGAGLNNLIFAKNNPKVIEFLPFRRLSEFTHYFNLSACLDLKYYCLIDSRKRFFINKKNIHVEPLKLKELLNHILGDK